jgi:hypothetical protein
MARVADRPLKPFGQLATLVEVQMRVATSHGSLHAISCFDTDFFDTDFALHLRTHSATIPKAYNSNYVII